MRGVVAAFVAALAAACAGAADAAPLPVGSQKLAVSQRLVRHGSCTLSPTADTYVDQAHPLTNHGSAATLSVSVTKKAARYAFVRFDPSACGFPAGYAVDVARLTVTVASAPSSSRTLKLFRAGGAWGESSLEWTNQPTVGSSITSAGVGSGSGSTTFSVTSEVAAILAGTANDGWQLRDSATTSSTVGYWSAEAGATGPSLAIDYAY